MPFVFRYALKTNHFFPMANFFNQTLTCQVLFLICVMTYKEEELFMCFFKQIIMSFRNQPLKLFDEAFSRVMSQPHSQHYLWDNPTGSILSLNANIINWTSVLFIWLFSFSGSVAVVLYGMLLLVLYDDGTPLLFFFFFSLHPYPWYTLTHPTTNTHISCCAVSWLAAFWTYVPHGALSPS